MILSSKKRYLQIAFNSNLNDAYYIISRLPVSDRIILEAGTPLIKQYGMSAVSSIKSYAQRFGNRNPYVVADMKTMDRAETEVTMAVNAGASAVIGLGQAPLETVNSFVAVCKESGADSMIDMMNVEYPITVLRKLRKPPDVVVLHRGVDEQTFNPDKPIPYIQINKVLSTYNVLIAIAGGDNSREVQRAVFNGANIVVVWREFYKASNDTGRLAEEFLKEIK